MIENLLMDLKIRENALKMLLLFLDDYLVDDIVTVIDTTSEEKLLNTQAIVHSLKLVTTDLQKLRNIYYDKMVEEKYNKNKKSA